MRDGRFSHEEFTHMIQNDDRLDYVRNAVNGVDVLVLDEVSMINKKDFEQLETGNCMPWTTITNIWQPASYQVIAAGDFL